MYELNSTSKLKYAAVIDSILEWGMLATASLAIILTPCACLLWGLGF